MGKLSMLKERLLHKENNKKLSCDSFGENAYEEKINRIPLATAERGKEIICASFNEQKYKQFSDFCIKNGFEFHTYSKNAETNKISVNCEKYHLYLFEKCWTKIKKKDRQKES